MIENKIKPSTNRFKVPENNIKKILITPNAGISLLRKQSCNSSTASLPKYLKPIKLKPITREIIIIKQKGITSKTNVLNKIKSEVRIKF